MHCNLCILLLYAHVVHYCINLNYSISLYECPIESHHRRTTCPLRGFPSSDVYVGVRLQLLFVNGKHSVGKRAPKRKKYDTRKRDEFKLAKHNGFVSGYLLPFASCACNISTTHTALTYSAHKCCWCSMADGLMPARCLICLISSYFFQTIWTSISRCSPQSTKSKNVTSVDFVKYGRTYCTCCIVYAVWYAHGNAHHCMWYPWTRAYTLLMLGTVIYYLSREHF